MPTTADPLPETLHVVLERAMQLRYGRPASTAALYRARGCPRLVGGAVQHGGRELSYLNLLDAERRGSSRTSWSGRMASARRRSCRSGDREAHEPLRVAVAEDLATAYRRPGGRPVSAFGGSWP